VFVFATRISELDHEGDRISRPLGRSYKCHEYRVMWAVIENAINVIQSACFPIDSEGLEVGWHLCVGEIQPALFRVQPQIVVIGRPRRRSPNTWNAGHSVGFVVQFKSSPEARVRVEENAVRWPLRRQSISKDYPGCEAIPTAIAGQYRVVKCTARGLSRRSMCERKRHQRR
jgi:hypothetical protein